MTVVIQNTLQPQTTNAGIRAIRHDGRILLGDVDLIVIAICHSPPDLGRCASTAVHGPMEWMMDMVVAALGTQRGLEIVPSQGRRNLCVHGRPHRCMCMPSHATSIPCAASSARSGEASSRMGLVLLM